MKKTFAISYIKAILILIGLTPVSVLAGSTPKGKPFVEIQGQMVEVEGQIASIETQIEALIGKVTSLEERITANENLILALNADNINIQNQIGELINNSAINSADIAAALQQIQALQSEIESLDPLLTDEIASLKVQVSTLQDFVSSNSEGVQTLQSQLQNNFQLISALQEQITNINEQLSFKQDVLSGNCPEGSVLKYFDGQGNIQCEAIGATAGVSVTTVTQLIPLEGSHYEPYTYVCGSYLCDSDPICGVFSPCDYCPLYCTGMHLVYGHEGGSITCPDGEFLAGGGYINDYPEFVQVTKNTSSTTSDYNGRTWTVEATNTSETQYDIYVTANCVSFQP